MSPAVKSLSCPRCGGAVVIRGFEHTRTVVCENCKSVLDAKDPNLRVLQNFARATHITPRIPLGTRGTLRGTLWEVIGFQVRSIDVEGVRYSWHEYLLFNPYQGFRYLTEYEGHWNYVTPAKAIPVLDTGAGRPLARFDGATFRHFQSATAQTTYVLGEFPWEVRVGDSVRASDFVAPPRMLSSESTEDETTWSVGEYTPGRQIWKAFKLPGGPPETHSVFANQPSPHTGATKAVARMFGVFALVLVALMLGRWLLSPSPVVFRGSYSYRPADGDTLPFVTEPFEIGGRMSNVEITTEAPALLNRWLFLNLSLIDEATGAVRDFGREVTYYEGYDPQDGRWTEGSRTDRAVLASVPPGRYFLRVAPEASPGADPIDYRLRVRRDVPRPSYFLAALVLLALPPVALALRAAGFEKARWAESDYAPSGDDDE